MGASRFVGRVGGLAVALGVGAAVFTGYGVAWADGTGTAAGPSSTGSAASGEASTGSSAGSEAKGSADGTGASARAASSPSNEVVSSGGTRSSSRSKGHSRADVARSRVGSAPASSAPPAGTGASVTSLDDSAGPSTFAAAAPASAQSPLRNSVPAPVVDAVAAVQSAPKPPPAPAAAMSGFLTTVVSDLLKPFSGDNPVAPVDSPLALALVAFTRRESANAVASSSTPSALSTTSLLASSNPVQVNPTLDLIDGILNGNANANAPIGTPLTYTLIGEPSLGGKITFVPKSSTGAFTYLPDVSVLNAGADEQFKILVSQNTPFDQFLTGLPIIGGFVPQVLVILHQTPLLGDLLAPIIGYSQVAVFDSSTAAIPVGAPVAFTAKVSSFDGTLISTNFFPASTQGPNGVPVGTAAPTVLNGPGLASAGATNPYAEWTAAGSGDLVPGLKTMREAGYNVITWDPRGEFDSGGILQLDSPFYEARDVTAIIDWATGQNTTGTDFPYVGKIKNVSGDPLLGMVGGSYGGGIQWVTAATDDRVDAIVPGISWNSLNSSLYPDSAFKTSYASLLLLSLVTTGARINNQIYVGIITGDLLGVISEVAQSVLASSGPTVLVNNIDIPTLLIQGTVDVLFPLDEAMANQQVLIGNGVTTKMIWYCGGHGNCLYPPSALQNGIILDSTMAWLNQYVKGAGASASSIPNFQYVDQYGQFYKSNLRPTDTGFVSGSVLATGAGGLLGLFPVIGGSGPLPNVDLPYSLGGGSPASNAVNVDVPGVTSTKYIVGTPTLKFDYSGIGTSRFVYAQLVDTNTGLVVDNIVTPVPVTLDGQQRSVEIPMEAIAYTMKPGDSLRLQITSSATPFENFTQVGVINISNINLSLPTTTAVTSVV